MQEIEKKTGTHTPDGWTIVKQWSPPANTPTSATEGGSLVTVHGPKWKIRKTNFYQQLSTSYIIGANVASIIKNGMIYWLLSTSYILGTYVASSIKN